MAHQIKKGLGSTLRGNEAEFRVWAPFATSVTVAVPYLDVYDGSNHYDMTPEDGGYWCAVVPNVEAGQSYKYLITAANGDILEQNDPRARVLTASENGVSVVATHDFDWGDDLFMPIPAEQQIIYELHIGTFSRPDSATPGTFYNAIEKLDYLQQLGVNMIEVMPVTSMTYGNGWGYNTNNIFSVESAYGGRHGFMEFIKACHTRGIGVILDVVYNHFTHSDLWQFDGWSENDRGGIYFYNDERGDTPWGARPDYGRPEVRQFILDSVVMWLNEYRVDGLRLDSTAYMRNTTGHNDDPEHDIPDAWSLLQDITTTAHKVRPGAMIIAEDTSVNSYITAPIHARGAGFDAQWGLDFSHAIRQAIGLPTPFPADLSAQLMQRYNDNAFQRVIFSDSHDTAANGSVRLNEAVTPGNPGSLRARQQTILTSAITLTAPGVPMLLQGLEFMQEGAFNDWQELQWDKTTQFAGIVEAHQHLINLRRNSYGNTAGLLGQTTTIFHYDTDNHVFGYVRKHLGGPCDDTVVIVNLGNSEQQNYIVHFPSAGEWTNRFNSSWRGYSADFHESPCDRVTTDTECTVSLRLPAYSVLIFSQE